MSYCWIVLRDIPHVWVAETKAMHPEREEETSKKDALGYTDDVKL
jgi:hypothetical protein